LINSFTNVVEYFELQNYFQSFFYFRLKFFAVRLLVMYKGVTMFRHWKDGAGAKASLFVPFLSFCVFKDTAKALRLQCSEAMQGNGWIKQGGTAGNGRQQPAVDGSRHL
jgi:hypothetical protein